MASDQRLAALARLQGVIDAISKSQRQGEFTDFTLTCEGESFLVHKVIVCSQSTVLRAACSKPFKEALSGVYIMEEDSLPMIKKLIDYFYTADYNENVDQPNTESHQRVSILQVHARMFALADKYDIGGLRVLSAEKFSSRFKSSPDGLELLESVPDVYTLTPPSVKTLRSRLTLCARIILKKSLQDKSVREVYEKIANEYPDFIKEVLDLYIKAPLFGNCLTCGNYSAVQTLQARCLTCKGSTHCSTLV